MNDWTKRLALAGLVGFFVFLLALPISCCGFVLLNEHRYGDVESGGPVAILGAMGISAVLALLVAGVIWRRSKPRS